MLQADTALQSEEMQEPDTEALPVTTSEDQDEVRSESLVLPTGDVPADDPDVITDSSLTLPRIEQVLRSEGVRPLSITQQIDSLRKKVARCASTILQSSPQPVAATDRHTACNQFQQRSCHVHRVKY